MATVLPVEAQIQDVISLRDHCTLTLSDEMLQRIRLIREVCTSGGEREPRLFLGGVDPHPFEWWR